jgi:hypothetical protein
LTPTRRRASSVPFGAAIFPMPSPLLPLRAQALRLLLVVACIVVAASARADAINVRGADLRLEDDQYLLNAEFEFSLSPTLEEALQRGIPLYFVLELEIARPRWYWFDEKLVAYQTTTRLSYNALTRQYRLSSGLFSQTAPSLEDAIRLLSRVRSREVARRDDLPKGYRYEAALRLRLDGTQLPKPIQISALAARDWQLSSDWYRWTFEAGADR